ncbi:MAG: T9SS type A sorting domain-containing protein, partial [Calditrichaeota bacterium]|nr:T9SS type A sorting domain-containing protein [Calditrichota bacterium]
SYYPEEQFRELDNCEWYDIIVAGYDSGNPGVVVYNYGQGTVMVSGCPVGYQWRYNNNEGQWGSTQDELLEYLSSLSSSSWMDFQPRTGIVSNDEDFIVTVTLDSRNQRVGDYEAELIFSTNDPEHPEVVIPVSMTIIGAPQIAVTWPLDAGYPNEFNWNNALGNLFVENEYTMSVQVSNDGSDDLEINEITLDNEYFTINFEYQEIEPDHTIQLDIHLRIPEEAYGNHSAVMTIHSNDPDDDELSIEMFASVYIQRVIEYYSDFTVTDLKHRITVTEFLFEGDPAPTDWEIGVFTPSDVLSGGEVWVDYREGWYFYAYGDDPQSDEQDGFRDGERFFFRVWDNQADVEYEAFFAVNSGSGEWEENGETSIAISALSSVEREISFSEGWNMISLNIYPPREMFNEDEYRGPDIVLMTERLRIDEYDHHIVIMKDERGHFYDPLWEFNDIDFWNLEEGYIIHIDEDVTVAWSGLTIPAQSDIEMSEGWNMISYFPTYELDALAPDFNVLSPIIEHVIIAKDANGNFLVPAYEYSEMQPWRQTQGYQICIDEDLVFNYPEEAEENAGLMKSREVISENNHWAQPARTNGNMSVLITSIEGMNVKDGSQIAVFNSLGVYVGTGFVRNGKCGLAVWGDDLETEWIDGLKDGECFDLKLWEIDRELEVELEVESIELGRGVTYSEDGFTVIKVTTEYSIPLEYYIDQNYPNPFNSVTRISYGLPEASRVLINVYDLSGRYVDKIVDGYNTPGHYSVIWNAEGHSSGVYLISMKTSEFNRIRRTILIK